jgi:hypothetical protein
MRIASTPSSIEDWSTRSNVTTPMKNSAGSSTKAKAKNAVPSLATRPMNANATTALDTVMR